MEHFDVLVVGAGISGVGAGYHLQTLSPNKSYAIFEGRDAIGGTWDLFRYPGVRSDSDMYTLGFSFRPWKEAKAIADGPSILSYLRETAKAFGIDRHIRYGRKVKRAAWDSARSLWTVDYESGPDRSMEQVTCGFLFMCAGYYNYAQGYRPPFAGEEQFRGRIVHPQAWPEDLDYAGKRVVVIGSGATAVTLVPEMARTAAHVAMLQRSPTYVVSRPAEDAFANRLRKWLPAKLAYDIVRWRNVLAQLYFFNFTRKRPEQVKTQLINMVREQLGPDYDVGTHFTPRYNPWDQRLCLVPDADLFEAIRTGAASVVTDHVEAFEPDGIRLKSGQMLPADIIVTATGLDMQLMGGLEVEVDGAPVELAKTFSYKAMMYSGVPNLASTFGYTNASWTLKADLTAEYVCRLLNHMDRRGFTECRPVNDEPLEAAPWLDFSSGYVTRAMHRFPKQGPKAPWRVYQNYALDLMAFRYGRVDDGVMRFSKSAQAPVAESAGVKAAA
ncbi:MAG TPA: NAD(P)/FAD-dependent oxidoreductase [Caulobacteraceae bacterium]|jgi:cation diffusion facilitator CzcD-associated flavoprotein CzcO|nr:NAD(P)/FAD-dependent oxidoreductase [Caulobacteraceae bacterium]